MINFNVLGAGGAVPTKTHSPAAYWVGLEGQNLLLDPGPGALIRLLKSGLEPGGVDGIDLVLLSHLHPDHSLDLIALLFAAHSPICLSEEPLRVFGPGGLKDLLAKWQDIYGRWLEPRHRKLEILEWDEGEELTLPGSGTVEPFRVNHPQDRLSEFALGYRFIDLEGNIAVFSGDTGACPALNKAAHGAHLLVVECSVPDELATGGHLNPALVGALCAESRPHHVVLTHQYPAAAAMDLVKEVGQYFEGKISQARDGDSYQVG
jgi:ribonuclease BN (tRNA processing enzyme)